MIRVLAFIWQLPQTLVALIYLVWLILTNNYLKIEQQNSIQIVETKIKIGSVSLGSYIFGPPRFKPHFSDHLLIHELGHSVQSILLGPFYLLIIGLPSLLSAWWFPKRHDQRWFETWTNRLAIAYAKKHFVEFESSAFVSLEVESSYRNHRNNTFNRTKNPLVNRWSWIDFLVMLPTGIIVYLLIHLMFN